VGANKQLRAALQQAAAKEGFEVFFPTLELCTDNGAMIALAGALTLSKHARADAFDVLPRWPLSDR